MFRAQRIPFTLDCVMSMSLLIVDFKCHQIMSFYLQSINERDVHKQHSCKEYLLNVNAANVCLN